MRLLIICISLLSVLGCKSSDKTATTTTLDPKEFNRRITENNVQLVDVRTQEEFEQGHIINAINISINDKDFEKKTDALYKDLPVYVYCKSDARSDDAASRLKKQGFKEVLELKGGITEWTKAGLPVKEKELPKEKIDYRAVINDDKLVLVDFKTSWCRPCKMMEPFITRMQEQRKEEVVVLSIDAEEEFQLAGEYAINSYPTIMLFRKGKVLNRSSGYLDEQTLNALVDKHL